MIIEEEKKELGKGRAEPGFAEQFLKVGTWLFIRGDLYAATFPPAPLCLPSHLKLVNTDNTL